MKADRLSREEMLKLSRKIYRNLNERLGRIREMENAPVYALNKFRELQENYPRDIRRLSDSELRKYYRQLRYINSLKSSRVESVRKMSQTWTPISSSLKIMSKKSQNEFWDIYKKIYENTGISELFKYDLLEYITHKRIWEGEDSDEIVSTVTELFNKVNRGRSKDELDKETAIRFADELYELLQ